MGDAPQAPGDRQSVAYLDNQQSMQYTDPSQSPEKVLSAAAKDQSGRTSHYPQHNAFSQASRVDPSQHGNPFPGYQQQQVAHGFDMGAMGLALPGAAHAPASYANAMPVPQTGMGFRPQVPAYSAQGYPPNMAMHSAVPRAQAQPSSLGPRYYYNPYGASAPQMSMPPQGQLATGYAAIPRMSFGHEVAARQSHPRPYSNQFGQSSDTQPTPSYPRGPPRKPKQSGHALWVGNLPPATTIGALKDHFSREATDDIESLFLISKSNCAFVNYRSEAACFAAMDRFHDSRFQGVRLVCRPRRGTPNGGSTRTPDADMPGPGTENDKSTRKATSRSPSDPVIVDGSAGHSPKKEAPKDLLDKVDGIDGHSEEANSKPRRVPEKYFVVKSLTLQDLEASVRNGVWATQSHNEVALNHAYETADSVFLVFSANKSGEYFGYARMLSPITSDTTTPSTSLHPKPKDMDTGPKSIPTPATQWAPKGRIVDDSARGTIFWEAVREDGEYGFDESQGQEKEAGSKQLQEWGKSFKVEWISTNRLSFYRTRGLRNPWNENREIKIARDGTEIEPSIGQRLVQMFHRPAQGALSMPPNMSPTSQHFT